MTAGRFEIGTDGPSKLLVCVDGSETSMRAGAFAAGASRRGGSQLIVAFVASPPVMTALAADASIYMQEALDEQSAAIAKMIKDASGYYDISVTFRSAYGHPFKQICRLADEERVDAIIVGASARASHRLAGSLGVRLVRAARWPVVVVP